MKNKEFSVYYIVTVLGVLAASGYPLFMGARVITDMLADGAVLKENYPKYIIPYTPISIAVLVGTLLLPICLKCFKKFACAAASSAAVVVFGILELLFEQKVVVVSAETAVQLEDWQMYMCISLPEILGEPVTAYRTQTAADILIGNYNPAFKLHFYIISLVLICSILNCVYGFAHVIKTGEKKRLRSLVIQAVCSLSFLGLCILACFTAFWRDGNIQVSPLSACLMTVFFILLGVTVGTYVGSYLLGKGRFISIAIPAAVSSIMTLLMYAGEMILLNGQLYKFGTGFMFDSLSIIVLAPVDLLTIILSGGVTAFIFLVLNKGQASDMAIKDK